MTRRRSPSCHQEDTDPMDTAATPPQPADTEAIAGQQAHWASTFDANPDMYGTDPSVPALAAAEAFAAAGYHSVLELGAGQGRDSIDASYSHMLFCMALTTGELERLAGELFRVLRPGGLVVYTARTTADAHYGTGTPRGGLRPHRRYRLHRGRAAPPARPRHDAGPAAIDLRKRGTEVDDLSVHLS